MNILSDLLLNDLGVGASIIIVGGGVLGTYRAIARLYSRTIGSRRDLARRLNQLAAGVTLRYVEERFGTPAFVRTFPASTPAVSAHRRPLMRELVQCLADPDAAAVKSPIVPAPRRMEPQPCGQSGSCCSGRSTHGSKCSSTKTMPSSASRSRSPTRDSGSRSGN